jgi:hypothetical protein
VKKLLLVALYVAGGLVMLCVAFVVFVIWNMGHDHDNFAARKNDLPLYVAGRWDWTTRRHPCVDSAHVISFGADGRTMEIRHEAWKEKGNVNTPTVYDILQITPTRIRGAIRGEKRLTSDRTPVVWDLVMFSANEYHWQRTDWPSWSYTNGIVRCSPKESGGGIAVQLPDGTSGR